MKSFLKSKNVGSLLIHFAFLILLVCMKNDNANSQTQTAIQPRTQKQAKAKTSSQKHFAPESANKAIAQAQQNGDFLYMLFYEKKDDSFQEMQKTVQSFSKNSAKAIKTYTALTTDIKESDVIQKYGINRVSLPVLLAFAPNGAITGGFPQKVTEKQLSSCMVSRLIMNVLKSVQAQKIALVLLQNKNTKFNTETTNVADEFSKDERLIGYVDIIKQDPNDGEIKDFLTQCKIESATKEATTVLIVPPGKIGGVYSGKVTKEILIAGLASCSSGGCGSSCGPR